MKSNEVPERKLIDEKFKWNLEAIYSSFEEWQKSYDEIQNKIEALKDYSGKLGEGSKTLLSFIKDDEEVSLELNKLYAKINLWSLQALLKV